MSRITLRLDDELKDDFKNHCDRQGKNMSERLKEFIRRETGNTGSKGLLPDDPELAKAYRFIWQITNDANQVTVRDAEPQLANKLNMPTMAVRRTILHGLEARGYITVKVGIITANVNIDQPQAGNMNEATV